MLTRYLKLSELEKKTFVRHFTYSVIEGMISGTLLMNEFVFIRSLGGGSRQLAVLFQFSVIILILTVLINALIKRIENKPRLLLFTGVITRGPLLLLLLFPISASAYGSGSIYPVLFLGIFFIFYFADPVILPTINLLLKVNYSYENFGKLYSYAISAKKICELSVVLLFGFTLETNPYAFVYVYPVIGALGMLSIFLLSGIGYDPANAGQISGGVVSVIRGSVREMFRIIKLNRPYRDFEIGFMLYGCAFMMSFTVIALYLANELQLSFASIGFYKNSYNLLAIILLPVMGRMIGNIDPRKYAVVTFSAMLLYIFFVAITGYFPMHFQIAGIQIYFTLVLAYLFFGIFAGSMGLLWSIGSAYFCRADEADGYQSIHMTLTGVRGLFAPILGVQLYEIIGFQAVFMLSISALFISILVMLISVRARHRIKGMPGNPEQDYQEE